MGWNFRIMATKCKITKEVYFQIHEVVYNKKGKPNGYAVNPSSPFGEKPTYLKEELENMLLACNKPILWTGKKFPKIYKKK